jgi:hypothetical protein
MIGSQELSHGQCVCTETRSTDSGDAAVFINFIAGETVANAVFATVGIDGKICVFTSTTTHIVADVNGFFPPARRMCRSYPIVCWTRVQAY